MKLNTQPISKAVYKEQDGSLTVHSLFSTLQGEGPFAGQPAIFVRLAGCNLQCPLCDTDYTSSAMLLSPAVIYDHIQEQRPNSNPSRLVVITGGEPFRQRLGPLVNLLLQKGLRVQIETNGTLYQDLLYSNPDLVVVCSPKTGNLNTNLTPFIRAYKYVVKTGDVDMDGLPIHALDHSVGGRVARPPMGFPRQHVYVQPIDVQDAEGNEKHLETAVNSCLKHGYTLCLQTHKLINLP